jgi:Uma2 family endonuclease
MPHLVRIPDVSFVSWKKLPDRELPAEPIPDLAPDLAVEVLSEGDTAREMQLKQSEHLSVGVRLVWFIDPAARSAMAYRARTKKTLIGPEGALEGGAVLPGFRLPLQTQFSRAGCQQSRGR